MRRALALVLLLASCKHSQKPITVGAAISLKEAMEDFGPTLEREKDVKIDWAFGASGDLASQMERGAPFDVLVAAGEQPRLEKIAVEACTLAWNKLVLVKRRGAESVTWNDLGSTKPSFRLAIGLVPQVPAGVYAEKVLRDLGAWEKVEPHVVRGTNVRNVLDLVARGEADEGIVYATDVNVRADIAIVDLAPPTLARIEVRYPVYVAKTAPGTSSPVVDFLCDSKTRKAMVARGFADAP